MGFALRGRSVGAPPRGPSRRSASVHGRAGYRSRDRPCTTSSRQPRAGAFDALGAGRVRHRGVLDAGLAGPSLAPEYPPLALPRGGRLSSTTMKFGIFYEHQLPATGRRRASMTPTELARPVELPISSATTSHGVEHLSESTRTLPTEVSWARRPGTVASARPWCISARPTTRSASRARVQQRPPVGGPWSRAREGQGPGELHPFGARARKPKCGRGVRALIRASAESWGARQALRSRAGKSSPSRSSPILALGGCRT